HDVDVIGPGRARGFRPGSGELLVETGTATSVRDASDRQVGSIPGTDATWSPDGTRVAFLEGDVLAVPATSGADVRPLASGIAPPSSDVTGPVWSPDGSSMAIATASAAGWSHDGSTLAFERNDSGRWSIWLAAPDGSGAREAIGSSSNNRFPQWSP